MADDRNDFALHLRLSLSEFPQPRSESETIASSEIDYWNGFAWHVERNNFARLWPNLPAIYRQIANSLPHLMRDRGAI